MKTHRLSAGRLSGMSRRAFLRGLTRTTLGTAAFASLGGSVLGGRAAKAFNGHAERVIFFYFPDGVPGTSQDGNPSRWHCHGSEFDFTLPDLLQPLAPFKEQCVFFKGLSMGGTDNGSHPGGAKKLLTGVDGGNGWSIDHYLGQTFGTQAPHWHLRLGAMANHNNASGDKHITYVGPGQTVPPQDDPRQAFSSLFGGDAPIGQLPTPDQAASAERDALVLDAVLDEVNDLKARLGSTEASKLNLHLDALEELQARALADVPEPLDPADCSGPLLPELSDNSLYDPSRFPDIIRAQMDLMITAMACGLTKVGTLQCSHHTSELIMSRFEGTDMYTPNFDMRSHQASHYGPVHDTNKQEYAQYYLQRKYWVEQFAYLVGQLASRPEGDGTMLDQTLLVLCTEVSDGNTHSHDDVPFILAGGAGGAFSTGRLIDTGWRRHSDLLVSIARATGDDIWSYGSDSSGPVI
jgi:hypothetical protein